MEPEKQNDELGGLTPFLLYQVETKVLNRAVKRNDKRFPPTFMFQLSGQEFSDWRSQIVTSSAEADLRFQNGTSSGLYNIGASLKDLGKKWFAFSKIEKDALRLVERLDEAKGVEVLTDLRYSESAFGISKRSKATITGCTG